MNLIILSGRNSRHNLQAMPRRLRDGRFLGERGNGLVVPSGCLCHDFRLTPSPLSMAVRFRLKFRGYGLAYSPGICAAIPPAPACLTTKYVRLSVRLIRGILLS